MKPPPEIAALPAGDSRADARPTDRLHMTILPFWPGRPALIEQVTAALETTGISPFRVAFDRIHGSERTVALRSSETMRGSMRAQAAIRDRLLRYGIPLPRYAFHPHITLAYRRGPEAIDAVSWWVEDIRLIESVTGRGLHIEHARWTLHAPLAAVA